MKSQYIIIFFILNTMGMTAFANKQLVPICEVKDEVQFYKDFTSEHIFRIPCTWLKEDQKTLTGKAKNLIRTWYFSCRNELTGEKKEYVYCGTAAISTTLSVSEIYLFRIAAYARYGRPNANGKGCENNTEYEIYDHGSILSGQTYEASQDDKLICEL